MMITGRFAFVTILFGSAVALGHAAHVTAQVAGQIPDAIAAKGETIVLIVHAEGAQVYDCKAGGGGKLSWQFREPVATLIQDGKTVGRHYVGPTWEHVDGSRIVGIVIASVAKAIAPTNGPGPKDIPWLKLEVVEARGGGALASVTAI